MASIVFISKCIPGSATGNQCMGFNHILLVMESTRNNEVISLHFILINYSKTGQMRLMKRTCQSHVYAFLSTWNIWFSTNLEEGGTTCVASVLTTTGAICAVETLN
jgi:hypothetical protein